jgi:hypothetical protein
MSVSPKDAQRELRTATTAPRWLHSASGCCDAELDVRDFVSRSYATFCAQARRHELKLVTEVSGPLPAVAGCAAAVSRVLHRAVTDAIEDAPSGALVIVAASAHADGVTLEVGTQELVRAGLWRSQRRAGKARFCLVLPRVELPRVE